VERVRSGAIVSLVVTLALLAWSGNTADAKPSFKVQERSLRLTLPIEGSNGFHGSISTRGHKRVELTLIRGSELIVVRTRGQVNRNGIAARFGDLGKISVRFRSEPGTADPTPPRRGSRGDPAHNCHGRDPILERGVFRGAIEFHGENDFTQIDAKAVPGRVERRFRRVCKQSLLDGLDGLFEELFGSLRLHTVEARARIGDANVTFVAASFSLGSTSQPVQLAVGSTVEHREGLFIVRGAYVEEEGVDSFRGAKPGTLPQVVTVAPPKPFLESATHRKEPGLPALWTGSLAVHLPGAGVTPLTGPRFKSAYCNLTLAALSHGGHCLPRRAESGAPEPTLLAALARTSLQGSGSQSQAFWDARLSWSR
jgi:hypothetical protein